MASDIILDGHSFNIDTALVASWGGGSESSIVTQAMKAL